MTSIDITFIPSNEGEGARINVGKATFIKLRDMIGAEYADMLPIDGGKRYLIIDDEGLLRDKSLNTEASRVAGRPIVGDAIIARREDLDAIPFK